MGFVLYAVRAGGGILGISPMPGMDGSYAADLAHLRDWRPALVLSMVPMTEMVAAGAGDFGQDIQDMGARWMHLPVADFGVPDPQVQASWTGASAAALSALGGGGRVLIHCRGGCGRSGMAALRLMVEGGVAPQAGLARLRAVRPCAVETEAQYRWAAAGRTQG